MGFKLGGFAESTPAMISSNKSGFGEFVLLLAQWVPYSTTLTTRGRSHLFLTTPHVYARLER
jgi:hypothetical protein